MVAAMFKDLCIDAAVASTLGAFWGEALGLEVHHQADGDAFLSGPTDAHRIWINEVPEPKTTKHRLHLDLYGSSAAALEAIGASVIDATSFSWVVMADPEGGEFCVFERKDPPSYRLHSIVFDCVEPEADSRWWASMIGGRQSTNDQGISHIDQIPNAPFTNLCFLRVDELKTIKNRVHLDLVSSDIDALIEAGATLVRQRDDKIGWDVLADPAGNEFCVFAYH